MSSIHNDDSPPAKITGPGVEMPPRGSPPAQPETQSLKPRPALSDLPTIGPFRTLEVLGRGAMGIVYLAEQTSPIRRRVALKVVRLGMDTKEVIARFERERQAMALMDHPNIARVFDAGETEDGRPYFAMEHVPGLPITKFSDQHKLTTRQRLELFAEVCEAVEHAHQKGLIHRDIKPSNILVRGSESRPMVKVIDFGIAKSIGSGLYEDTFHTRTGQFVGTPAYMSPEQAGYDHAEIDTRTDVYSLGMVLYELLVGVLPFDFSELFQKTLVQIQRFIIERDPVAPSTRLARLGDEALAIAAQRGTDRTHLQREIRGDLDWILMKALEKDPNHRYRSAFDLAADVRHYLASEPISVGRPTLRYRAAKFIRRRRRAIAIYGLAASFCIAAVAAGASIWRARGLAREVARGEFMGAQIEALRNPQEAIDQLTQLAGEHPNYLEPQVALAYLFFRENRIPESIEAAGRVLTEDPANGPAHLLLSIVYRHRDPERAEEHRRRGHEVVSDDRYYRALALPASESAEAASILSDVLVEQGTNFDARWARAWRYFELGRYDKMLEDANYLVQSRRDSATALNTRGVALNGLDRFNEALDAFSRALEITPDHASTYLNRAGVYFSQGQVALGLADCQRAIAKEPNFAEAYAYRAFARQMMGKLEEASADCAQALRLQPRNATARWVRSRILRQQGNLAAAAGEVEQALVIQPNNVDFRVDRAGMMMGLGEYEQAFADYSAVCTRRETAEARHGRGLAASRVGAYDIALADFDRAIELDGRRAQYFGSRARLYRWMGEYQRALADNDKAVELAPDVLDGYASRGVSRWLAGDLGGAVKDFEKGLSIDAGRGAPQLLWLWQIHGMRGDSEAASAALAKAAELVRDPWLSHIVAFLRGTKTEQQLLEKAAGDRQRFDVYYYLGAKASAEGQNDDAQRWFQKCVNRDYVQDTEYDLALGLLAGLRQ